MDLILFDLPDEIIELIINQLNIKDVLKSRLISKHIKQIIDKEKIIENKKQIILKNINPETIIDRRNFLDNGKEENGDEYVLKLTNNEFDFENNDDDKPYFNQLVLKLLIKNDNKLILTFFHDNYRFKGKYNKEKFEIKLIDNYYKFYFVNSEGDNCILVLSDRIYYFKNAFVMMDQENENREGSENESGEGSEEYEDKVRVDFADIYQHKYKYNLRKIFMSGDCFNLFIVYPEKVIYYEFWGEEGKKSKLTADIKYFSDNVIIFANKNKYGRVIAFHQSSIITICEKVEYEDDWDCMIYGLVTSSKEFAQDAIRLTDKILFKLNNEKYEKCEKYIMKLVEIRIKIKL